ncbi:MAG TPA: PAS domain S-box protein, partial [Candidatus Nanopelagicales bacterium]|nr:PAS domain S-box protein [Candidatus Nanopelagicales bacterium]
GRILVVNDRWLTRLGYRRQEVLGRHSADFMTPASARHAREEILPALFERGRGDNVPCQFLGKHGEVVDMLLSGYLERGREGGPQRVRAVLTDVSEQMRMARALQESEVRYRALVELAPDGVAVLEGARIAYVNLAGARLLGAREPAALVGRDLAQLAPFADRDALRARLRDAETRGEHLSATEQLLRGDDGEPLLLELVAAPIIYEGIPALHLVLRDITERHRTEEANRRSALLEQTLRAQEEQVRSLSTPLVPLGNGVLLAPLVGTMDRTRTEQLLSVLLEGVVTHAARAAILDITGVPSIDAQVASSLARATRAVSLIGAEVILTGLSPSAARTLVELGVDLEGLTVRATLRDGLAYTLGDLRLKP